jgi:hypothetical protein
MCVHSLISKISYRRIGDLSLNPAYIKNQLVSWPYDSILSIKKIIIIIIIMILSLYKLIVLYKLSVGIPFSIMVL